MFIIIKNKKNINDLNFYVIIHIKKPLLEFPKKVYNNSKTKI